MEEHTVGSTVFHKIKFFKEIKQEYHQSVKTFGPNLVAKSKSRCHKSPVVGKVLKCYFFFSLLVESLISRLTL